MPGGRLEVMKYAVIIEKGSRKYGAYVPDLPGCTTSGKSLQDVRKNMREAIGLYLDELREQGLPVPKPTTHAIELEVA